MAESTTIVSVPVRIGNNYAQGGHDDYDDSLGDRLRTLRHDIAAVAQAVALTRVEAAASTLAPEPWSTTFNAPLFAASANTS